MTVSEHLLTCLMEECAEIQKAASKALRFGLAHAPGSKPLTNAQLIAHEVNDLVAVVELLEEAGLIERSGTLRALEEKKIKVKMFMNYAREQGTLKD